MKHLYSSADGNPTETGHASGQHQAIAYRTDSPLGPLARWRGLSALLLFLCLSSIASQLHAQSLQWSQYTGAADVYFETTDAKYAPDGSIYAWNKSFNGGHSTKWPTDDVKFLGNIGANAHATLSKYSPDGKLIWVRVLAGVSPTDPIGLAITPDGKLVVMMQVYGPYPEAITPNAFRSDFEGKFGVNGRGIDHLLMRLDADGNLEYGTYLGISGKGHYGQYHGIKSLAVGTDGSIRMALNLFDGATIPTTANAFQASDPEVTAIKPALMILNADGSLRYGSYFSTGIQNGGALFVDIESAPNNQFLWTFDRIADAEGGSPASAITYPITAGAAYPTRGGNWNATYLGLYNADGTLAHSTYLPGVSGGRARVKPNGNIVVVATLASEPGFIRPSEGFTYANPPTFLALCLFEFNPTLTAVVKKEILNQQLIVDGLNDAAIDDAGRLHVATYSGGDFNAAVLPTTPGALQASPTGTTAKQSNYQIYDCDYSPLHYASYLTGTGGTGNTVIYGIDTRGSKSLLSGNTDQNAFPVTPIAYDDAGTGTLTGFDIKRNNQANDGFLTQFNYPKINANVISAAITGYCQGAGVQPIVGQPIGYQQLSTVLGRTDGNPAPVSNYYQWQIATAAAGPWTDILDATRQSYTPSAQNINGSRYYRRLAQQTPFGATCQPTWDVQSISNVIEYQFSTNKVHTTNLSDKSYGLCKGGTINVTANLAPSSDGNQGAYNWKLTTLLDINTAVLSGTVAAAPSTIDLSINKAGEYLLQVTDARGCTGYDTLTVANMTLDAGPRIKFTCGQPTLTLGPLPVPPVYVNFPNPTFLWSPSTGLSNTSTSNPTLDIAAAGIGSGQSKDYYLTFNGCSVDTITITNQTIAPLPALPDLSACQGDTVRLGLGITTQGGITYEWAPGLGLTANNIPRPIVTTAYAPQGVNVINYTLLATNGGTGCAQTATQKVTTFRFPNQSFNLKGYCLTGSNKPSQQLSFDNPAFGTVSEPGISYEWTVTVTPTSGTTDYPTAAQVLSYLSSTTAAKPTLLFPQGVGHPATGGYSMVFVRKSYNTANPSCMRSDTAEIDYCRPGGATACAAVLGNVPTTACGSPTNKIGPANLLQAGRIVWSRLDGQPLSGLFDIDTNQPLIDGGPHSAQVIANPTGLVAITYRLTFYAETGDTCRLDVRVFPGAVSKPTANYTSPIAACKGTTITIVQTAQPAYSYAWSPAALVDDSTKANPTTIALLKDETLYVTVTDTVTKCFVQDTVVVKITPVDVNAGADGSYCLTSGATVNIGSAGKSGYTYQWSTSTAGVTFGNATASQTTAIIPANTAGPVQLILQATNGNTSANCTFKDTVDYTSFSAPAFIIPNPGPVCQPGGSVNLTTSGLPMGTFTYAWTTADGNIVGSASTQSIKADKPGTYSLEVSSGSCAATQQVTIIETVYPTVTAGPFTAPCAAPVTLAVTNAATLDPNWSFVWTPSTGVVNQSADFTQIQVYPSANTTYTLTAIFGAGCTKTFTFAVPGAAYAPVLPNNLAFCEGSGAAVLPLNEAPAGATYTWTASPASGLAYLSSPTAQQPTIDFTNAVNGTYTYTVTVTYGAGCQATATTTVKIGKKMDLAGLDKTTCLSTCVQIGLPALTGINYTWSAQPFSASDVATISNVSSAQPTVCPTKTTTYNLTYFDANTGCTFTDLVTVQATAAAPTLTVKNLKICQNATGTAQADLTTAITTNTGTATTYWINSSATIPATSTVNVPGTYYIKSVTADGFCSTIKPVTVTFYDLPTAVLTPAFDCITQKGTVQITTAGTGLRYDYTIGSTYTGSKTFATATALISGTLISNLTATTVAGQDYTVRIFGSDSLCSVDYTVKVSSPCPKGSLGDFVWKDTNNNGIQDETTPNAGGVEGVQIELYKNGTLFAKDTTDATGKYLFTNLDAGTYKIKVLSASIPAGCEISSVKDAPSDDAKDSDVDKTTGFSGDYVITPTDPTKKDILTVDAALYSPKGSLGDFVWKDTNNNGIQDETTPNAGGVEGVQIELYKNGTLFAKDTTDATGKYLFTNLDAGTYKIKVLSASIPAGCEISSVKDAPNDDAKDSDVDKATGFSGDYIITPTDPTKKDILTVDAALYSPKGSLGDFVWKDTNNNGIQDETTPNAGGVEGVQIELYKNGTFFAKDTTDATGHYLFSNLDAGTYKIKVLSASIPAGCEISSVKDAPSDDAKDSDVDKTTGFSGDYVITPTDPTKKDILTVDAALAVPCVKSKVTLTGAPVCSADVQTYSITFSVANKVGNLKVNKGTMTGSNPYTVSGIPSGATITITDSLSAVCKFDTLITGPNCNCNPLLPTIITPSLTACIGDTFPTLKATVVGSATVEWYDQPTGGTLLFTGLNFKPGGNVPAGGKVFYAQARSTDPTCPTAISSNRVSVTVNAQNCTVEVDLALKKSINTKIVQIGDLLTYTIKVWNESNTNATGVEVTDSIATTVQFVAGSFIVSRGSAAISSNVITWTIGPIAANGDTVTLTYKVKATLEGVHFNTAEISKTNEKDVDSTPGNGERGEDDIDNQCFTIPIKLCSGEKVQANVPASLTNVHWFKNGGTTPVATGNTVLLTEVGIYTFTATNQSCPVGGCCPIIIEAGKNCCPENLCIPFTIQKRKKK